MERKKKEKDEGKRKREEKEKKITPFDVFAKRREKKNVCFYLCALINDMKIHILEEQSLVTKLIVV